MISFFTVFARTSDGASVSCILFRRASEFEDLIKSGATIDVAGELSINEYNGRQNLQLIVKDIKRSKI